MRIFTRLLDFFLPTSCAYCLSPVGDSGIPLFCRVCWSDLAPIRGAVCPGCGRPFESPETLSHSPGHLCGRCRSNPLAMDQALSVGHFEGPLREAIHVYKYRPLHALGAHLGSWMAGHVQIPDVPDLVMPVPLHRKRLRQRGFNQSLLLAYAVGRKFGVTVSFDNLKRLRYTRPQVELSGVERMQNVAGAFGLVLPDSVSGKSVLIIDDVFTTGATLNECARVLNQAGASRVMVLTLARAGE